MKLFFFVVRLDCGALLTQDTTSISKSRPMHASRAYYTLQSNNSWAGQYFVGSDHTYREKSDVQEVKWSISQAVKMSDGQVRCQEVIKSTSQTVNILGVNKSAESQQVRWSVKSDFRYSGLTRGPGQVGQMSDDDLPTIVE